MLNVNHPMNSMYDGLECIINSYREHNTFRNNNVTKEICRHLGEILKSLEEMNAQGIDNEGKRIRYNIRNVFIKIEVNDLNKL